MKSLHCGLYYLMFQRVLSMRSSNFFLLFFVVIAKARVEKLRSYFIQKNFDYKSPPCTTCPDIECVHSGNSEQDARIISYQNHIFLNVLYLIATRLKTTILWHRKLLQADTFYANLSEIISLMRQG